MRLFKYSISIGIITLAALVYVHQQVELVKLSYEIDCKEKLLKTIIDRREILQYNISNLESPSRLEKILLSRNINVSLPKRAQIIRLTKAPSYMDSGKLLGVSSLEERAGIFRFFDFLGGRVDPHAREK